MPTVPNSFVPDVSQSATNTPAVSAPGVAPMQNFAPQQMEQMGREQQRAGLTALHMGNVIQEQLDDANVKAAESKFIQTSMDILHGENGYLQKQGADALNGYDAAQEAVVKAKQEVLDSLGNDVQKRMFQRVSQAHMITFGSKMAEHRAIQRNEYTSGEAEARSESLRAVRQNAPIGSPEHDALTISGVDEIKKKYAIKGIPADSEEVKKAIRDYRTKLVGDDLGRLVADGNYTEATSLFEEQLKQGNIDPDVAPRMRSVLYAKATENKVVSFVDENWQPGISTAEFDRKIVAAFSNPDERRQARMEWRDRESAYEADREKRVKTEVASIWDLEMKNTPLRQLFSRIDDLPTLDATQKRTLKDQVEKQRKPEGEGESKAQAWAVNMIPYLTDPTKAANLDPKDIAALAPHIGPSNVMFLSKMVGELQSTNTFPVPPEILKAEVSKAGWNVKDPKQAQLVQRAYSTATNELLTRKKNGEKIDRSTIEKTLRSNLAGFQTVTEDNTFWFDKKSTLPLGAMTDQQIQDAVKELPTGEVKAFAAYAQFKYGVATFSDQEQFLRAFSAWKAVGMPQAPPTPEPPMQPRPVTFGSIQ